jgi:hypothetical protein
MPGLISLAPIGPDPVRDFRMVDFTNDITPPTIPLYPTPPIYPSIPPPVTTPHPPSATISSSVWTIWLDPDSNVQDPDPSAHLIGNPALASTSVAQLIGECLDGCTYLLAIQANLSDGRVLVKEASLACVSYKTQLQSLPEGAIPFDYDEWIRKFPELSGLPEQLAQGYWDEAGLIFRNDCTSPEWDLDKRREILDLLTAHCAMLFAPPPIGRGGGGANALGGVLTNKSVDGVSVGSSGLFPGVNGTQAWYLTTQYGQKAWRLMAAYRTFHYVQGPQRYPYPPNRTWPPSYGAYYPYWSF